MSSPSELEVYRGLIDFLSSRHWVIICASPPAGTDNRFRKCLLPRRELGGNEKGPRDEVDLTAHNNEIILLVECKPKLSQSFERRNALSESDYDKLKRIRDSFSPEKLSYLLNRATGIKTPESPKIALALAVGRVDRPIQNDITILEFRLERSRIWPAEPMNNSLA